MATDIFIDVTDFQFRALRRVRLFAKPIKPRGEKISPSLIATSSNFGITVVGTPEGLLLSLRTSDVNSLQASHSNRDTEVSDIHRKTSVIPGDETDELVALGCSCSGRILSALVNTSNGPFVHLFDMCAFSPDFTPKAGVVRSIRVSSVDGAHGVALEWNPQLDGLFAVITTDGTLSTFLFDLENPERISIVGTTNLKVRGSCISWSPKGKQLVVGDDSGNVLQYKPEMVLVRTIAAPNNITSMQGTPLRCTGLCWLATTEFLVAYSPRNSDEVNIALLTVKKDAPPRWSHLEDVTYSGNRGEFHQKITFTALHQWQIVLCASSRSTEVALLGKIENVWKCWQLDDVSRIETSLGIDGEETFPLGVCIDTSSQIAVKLSDDEGMQVPPCPLVMLISSDGVLLSYNAISMRSEHQNINRASVGLPKTINAGEAPKRLPPQAKDVNDSQNSLAIGQFSSPSATDVVHLPTVSQELFKQPSISPSLSSSQLSSDVASSVQQASILKVQPIASIQAPSQQITTCTAQTSISEMKQLANSSSLMKATVNGESASVMSLPSGNASAENLTKLRAEFRKKLQLFDEEMFMLRERNDWLKDTHDSMQKNGFTDFSDISNEEGLLGEVEELRVCIDRLIGKLNSEIKELTILVRQEQENVRSAQLQPRHCAAEKLLDFDRWYRQNKLEKALQRVCSKVSVVENWLDSVATSPRQPSSDRRVEASLSVEDEQRIVTTARNVCKAITSRRNVLAELQRRFSDLDARYRLVMGEKAKHSSHSDKQPSVRNISEPFSKIEVTIVEEHTKFDITGLCSRDDMLAKLRSFAKRNAATAPRKINVTPLKPYKASTKKDTKSIISRIEARLEQSSSTLTTRSSQKMMMDIGTQSPDFLRPDVKAVSEMPYVASNIGVISVSNIASSNFASAALRSSSKIVDGTPRPQAPDLAKSVIATTSGTLSASRAFSVLSSTTQTPKPVPAPLSSTPLTAFKFTAPSAPNTSPISAATSFASTTASAIAVATVQSPTTQLSTNVDVTSKGGVFAQPAAVTVTSAKANKEVEKTITVDAPVAPPSIQIHPSVSTVAAVSKPAETSAVSMNSGGVVSLPPTGTTTVVTNAAPAVTPAATTATSSTAVTAVPTTTAPTAVAATTTVQSLTSTITTAVTTGVSTTQVAKAATTIESPVATTAESVSFTFKLPATVQKQLSPSTTSVSQEASVSNSMDEGMMDEEGPSAISSNLFSSSLSLGLGGTNSKSGNAVKNVFGGGLTLGTTSPSSSLFGDAANSSTGSVFGGAVQSAFQTNVTRTSSIFGGLTAATTTQQQQSTPSFSFSAALAKPQQVTTSAFGAKPVVGGTTTFGGAPAFGAKPTFGSPSPLASAFGQGRAAQPAVAASGGFSAFAHGGSSGFGALAASQQAQKSSVFGGSGFAALAQQQPAKSSIFGGAFSTQPNTQSSAFSTWR
uniref:Nuclear pore complex protein Nup214 n=1 Tax=Parascaris univalens TaxID=6257 RepID=A0A915AGU6_PARUN